MLTFIKILSITFAVLLAASYGVYITTDPVMFFVTVYPTAIAFALLADYISEYFYARAQLKLAARLDGRLVEQYERKKQREARNKLVAKK